MTFCSISAFTSPFALQSKFETSLKLNSFLLPSSGLFFNWMLIVRKGDKVSSFSALPSVLLYSSFHCLLPYPATLFLTSLELAVGRGEGQAEAKAILHCYPVVGVTPPWAILSSEQILMERICYIQRVFTRASDYNISPLAGHLGRILSCRVL